MRKQDEVKTQFFRSVFIALEEGTVFKRSDIKAIRKITPNNNHPTGYIVIVEKLDWITITKEEYEWLSEDLRVEMEEVKHWDQYRINRIDKMKL